MNVLTKVISAISDSVLEVYKDANFGTSVLMVDRPRNIFGYSKILSREDSEQAYKEHIEFLETVGDTIISEYNSICVERVELLDHDYNSFSDLSSRIDAVRDKIKKKIQAKVYVIKADSEYKIGFSSDPKKRINGVSSPSGKDKELLFVIESDNPRKLESFLHEVFSHKRISGEWFRLDDYDIEWIEKSIPFLEKKFQISAEVTDNATN